jgi:acetolactate synthase-1/2/3 large subunit
MEQRAVNLAAGTMNGAESLVATLVAGGIDTCFANPGTSEMHFVAALDRIPGIRCVLGLFEGVATGAADGYARMAGRPAATLLHCGPGLANGLANLHNARRAGVPMVNIVGDQASYHRPLDAPLTADTVGWAGPVSGWLRSSGSAAEVGADAAAAILAARTPPSKIATLILPSDVCWNPGGVPIVPGDVPPPAQVPEAAIDEVARLLRRGEPTVLMLAGDALRPAPLAAAHRIAAATGARLLAPLSNRRIARGQGRYPIERVRYVVDQASAQFRGVKHLVLVGALPPVNFFAYPGKPGRPYPEDARIHVLAGPEHDLADALAHLADALKAPPVALASKARPAPASGPVTPSTLAQSLGALLPENAIVVDESVSFGRDFFALTEDAPPHDWLQLTGGAIGDGLPLATGAAVGAPGRRVVTLQADGSALYTLQALWTQARERLDVTTVLLSNRKYQILFGELAGVGAKPGTAASSLFDLGNPDIDWVRLAGGLGVEGVRAQTMDQFGAAFRHANGRPGPFLIELVI